MQAPSTSSAADAACARLPGGRAAGQLEFALDAENPFDALATTLLNRTAGLFDLHLGMTLGAYQGRWLEIVGIAEEVTAQARAESARLHGLAREKGPGWRRWRARARARARAREVDGFIHGAFNVAEDWFISASEPLLAAYEGSFQETEKIVR